MNDEMPQTVTVPDEAILAVFERATGPITTVADITEVVDLQRDSVRVRLKQLEDEGRVKSKKVGSRAVVWWIVED